METVIMIAYMVIGLLLTLYWWDKQYEAAYIKAKESEEGADEPMSVLFLAFLAIFWPIVLVYKAIKRYG